MRKILLVTCFLAATAAVVWSAGPPPAAVPVDGAVASWVQVGALRAPQTPDPSAAKRELEDVYALLVAEQVLDGIDNPLEVRLTQREQAEIELGVCEGCTEEPFRQRVGIAKRVTAAVTAEAPGWGATRATADGGWVWSAAVHSDGASGLRLKIRDFQLPQDTELYLFNETGSVAGPYTGSGPLGSGEFWSHLVPGETVYLQLRQYGPAMAAQSAQSSFQVEAVGYVGSQFGAAAGGAKSFCDYNARCIVNASCVSDAPAVDDARYAVAHMLFADGDYLYACSGGLINNTDEDWTPYFMTANHCMSTDAVASTLEAFFRWTVDCGATCPFQWGTPTDAVAVLGASVVATNRVGDYTLLLLSGESAPLGTALLGWTTEPVAFSDGASLYRISHPAAAPQAFSEHRVDTGASTCLGWGRGSWIYSRDVVGATEGGSSGSPVVNSDGQMVGQLSGSCGILAWLPCLSGLHATVDGAFASYFDEVAPWLDPASVCEDDLDGDGYVAAGCGGDDCNDDDFFVNPGATETCDNGIDDDCDLKVDGDDPDCSICLPQGAACTRSADCCSRWCRWFGRTCR
jgi:hypothetical protein